MRDITQLCSQHLPCDRLSGRTVGGHLTVVKTGRDLLRSIFCIITRDTYALLFFLHVALYLNIAKIMPSSAHNL